MYGKDIDFKHSVTLQRLAETSIKCALYEVDQDGHWIILNEGWESETGASAIRADTVAKMKAHLSLATKVGDY